jgi:hypothetical protein
MSQTEPDIHAYSDALVRALRSQSPAELRKFAATWGERLHNRGLKALAGADDALVERRLWMMIRDRPDLVDLHPAAETWLAEHSAATE